MSTGQMQQMTLKSILNIYKVSLTVLEHDSKEITLHEYYYTFVNIYPTSDKAFNNILQATDLLKWLRVALGIHPSDRGFFVGQVRLQCTGLDGVQKSVDAGVEGSSNDGQRITDIFVKAAFGMIPLITIIQYGQLNKRLLIFEGWGKRFKEVCII